ncbi:hypothetical protein BMT54_00515 [Pasteurellaceae bacterium 15-036681]|nr:hypothetical protein BMT54_00515 [Pasteurellaceae bacterium 15-036681]
MSSSEIMGKLIEVQQIAEKNFGITNILQPGIIKELIMAEILGHQLVPQKDLPDAKDIDGHFYEYLASIRRVNTRNNRGCSFQMDRVTPNNLTRVTRNKAFYFGIFKTHLEIEQIWEVSIPDVLNEVKRQLENCKNDIAHVNFLLKWLENNGKLVYSSEEKN